MSVLLVVDGMTDLRCATPEQAAAALGAPAGAGGYLSTCPPGFAPESMPCLLTLLGVPAGEVPRTGRAYWEACAAGIPVRPEDLVLRCNLARFRDGKLVSAGAQGLSRGEARARAEGLARGLPEGFGEFFPLGGYKNLLVLRGAAPLEGRVETVPPHERPGAPWEALLPRGEAAGLLRRFAQETFARSGGEYALLPWGQSAYRPLPAFSALHGCAGGAVCRTGVAVGLARAMGLETPPLPHATADTDTSLTEKAQAAAQLAGRFPFVFVHVNGADEAAHRRNRTEKEAFLRRVGEELLRPLLRLPGRLLVCADHMTLPESGGHRAAPQPFLLYGAPPAARGVLPGGAAVELLLRGSEPRRKERETCRKQNPS